MSTSALYVVLLVSTKANVYIMCPDLLFERIHLLPEGFLQILHLLLTVPQQVLIGLELICQLVKSLL